MKFARLKVAQIDKQHFIENTPMGYDIIRKCYARKQFKDIDKDSDEFFCHADIFNTILNECNLRKEINTVLLNLNKQFISFDYIMFI